MVPSASHPLRSQKGAALIFVILALVIVSIFGAAVASMVRINLSQAVNQDADAQAYYLAQSGIDLCYAALLQEGVGGEHDTLLYTQFSQAAKPSLGDTPTLNDTLALDGGSVAIEVSALTKGGERWVKIRSTASLTDSAVTKTVTLQFQADNPLVQTKS